MMRVRARPVRSRVQGASTGRRLMCLGSSICTFWLLRMHFGFCTGPLSGEKRRAPKDARVLESDTERYSCPRRT